jgi:hypothetical protein
MKKGQVIEQGTHESLLANEDGAYWALVNAQKLSMGDSFADETDLVEDDSKTSLARALTNASGEANINAAEVAWKPKGFFTSFGLLLWEQRSHKLWYSLL